MTFPDGEGPSNRKASKERGDKALKDPKYHAEKGSKKDLRTVDDDINDPKHQKQDTNE
jgi:hypothetical protein